MDVVLNRRKLRVFSNGDIMDLRTNKIIVVTPTKQTVRNQNTYYYLINCNGKKYRAHRIVASLYLGLDINDRKAKIDHIDNNGLNNDVSNLRIVTTSQNGFNCLNTKGYAWHKASGKYYAYITLDYKRHSLGYYEKEEDARDAYLEAKKKYHIFNNDSSVGRREV